MTQYNHYLFGCHVVTWVAVFLCVMKGIKTSGKVFLYYQLYYKYKTIHLTSHMQVVYFTATAPYVIILILLIKGLTLEGALDGLYFLFVPKWEQLLSFELWDKAAQQVFFSLALCSGTLPTLASYNKFKNNFIFDVTFIGLLDFFTSIIMSCAMFCILGHLAHIQGLSIDTVATAGQGLIFIVFPEALSTIYPSWMWSLAFFLMIFLLGLDTEFVIIETVSKVVMDAFSKACKPQG